MPAALPLAALKDKVCCAALCTHTSEQFKALLFFRLSFSAGSSALILQNNIPKQDRLHHSLCNSFNNFREFLSKHTNPHLTAAGRAVNQSISVSAAPRHRAHSPTRARLGEARCLKHTLSYIGIFFISTNVWQICLKT